MIVSLDLGNATQSNRIVNGFAKRFNWQANIQDPAFPDDPTKTIPNPETKVEHYRRRLMQYSKDVVKGVESDEAVEPVRQAAETSANGITIT